MRIKRKGLDEWYKRFVLWQECFNCKDVILVEDMQSKKVQEPRSFTEVRGFCSECRPHPQGGAK